MLRWSAIGAVALMMSAGTVAEAQVRVTAVMKSGARHTGDNPSHRPDLGEFTLRQSVAEQLRVPGATVAYVDFGGTPDVDPNISGSQWALVLRDGTIMRGRLSEMGHVNPEDTTSEYLVSFLDEQGKEHRFQAQRVARIYFPGGSPAAAQPTTGSAQVPGGAIAVSARQQWTATGINVQKNETIRFTTTGRIQLSSDSNDVAEAAGSLSQRTAPNAPLPRAFAGALIGRIGPNGQPFAIGNQTAVPMPGVGQLFLGVNDDDLNDNQGEFRVEIQRVTNPIRRR